MNLEPSSFIAKQRLISILNYDRKPGSLQNLLLRQQALRDQFSEFARESNFQPSLISDQLMGVQPMPGTAGDLFKIRYVNNQWYKRLWRWCNARVNNWRS